MNKDDAEFEVWYGVLQVNVMEQVQVFFRDADAVRIEYDAGRCVYDVIAEIVAEYGSRVD